MKIRSKREAERLAHAVEEERKREQWLRHTRATGSYHSFGIEGLGAQSVCHVCSAVVQDRAVHSAWHVGLGQAMPQELPR